MVNLLVNLYPVIPAKDEEEREQLRPIGRHSGRYNSVVHGMTDIVKAADSMGVWGVGCIEHHFHSEGYEVGPSPGVLNAYWAAITENVRVGALGYVMSTQNPFRVAEETAILSHLTKGRYFVGFARGFQDRWTDVIGQHLGACATHDGATAAEDQRNRDIWTEQVELVIDCWTKESIEHNTPLWQVPCPYEDGIKWWMSDSTARLGAKDEVDSEGVVRRVSVVPAPYENKIPQVFVAMAGSEESVKYAAHRGYSPLYFSSIERTAEFAKIYQKEAKKVGRNLSLGQNCAGVRWFAIGDTEKEAREKVLHHDADITKNFYSHFRKVAGRADSQDNANAPLESWVDAFCQNPQNMVGTVSSIRDELVKAWKDNPLEYLCYIPHFAQQPKEDVIETIRLIQEEIKPALDELTQYESYEECA
jgi:alkanesulfonate monooxygenase SsuD/methylene tetrahydromethanopterin reductase-like flavin-dependent oxidoreductase (luciferase family)